MNQINGTVGQFVQSDYTNAGKTESTKFMLTVNWSPPSVHLLLKGGLIWEGYKNRKIKLTQKYVREKIKPNLKQNNSASAKATLILHPPFFAAS